MPDASRWVRYWWAPLLYWIIPAIAYAIGNHDVLLAQVPLGAYLTFLAGVFYDRRLKATGAQSRLRPVDTLDAMDEASRRAAAAPPSSSDASADVGATKRPSPP